MSRATRRPPPPSVTHWGHLRLPGRSHIITFGFKYANTVEVDSSKIESSPLGVLGVVLLAVLCLIAGITKDEVKNQARRAIALFALGKLTVHDAFLAMWSVQNLGWVIAQIQATSWKDLDDTDQVLKRHGNVYQHLRVIGPYMSRVVAHLKHHGRDVLIADAIPPEAVKVYSKKGGQREPTELDEEALEAWVRGEKVKHAVAAPTFTVGALRDPMP